MTKTICLLVSWTLLHVPCAAAQTSPLAPTYWKQRLFFIPYQVNARGKLLDPIAKVQLLHSRTGANDWQTLEEAEPNVQGFSYHAPEDGEYWFALRHLNRRGQPWPNAAVRPQMRLVVDTVMPELSLDGSVDVTGEIIIRYEARDANLQAESLLIEVLGSEGQWSPLRPSPPDIAQADRLLGRIRWRAPGDAQSVKLRAVVTDKAGQRGLAETVVVTGHTKPPESGSQPSAGPTLRGPFSTGTAAATDSISDRFLRTTELPSRDWPVSNRLPRGDRAAVVTSQESPPSSNPYSIANQDRPNRTPAKLVGDGSASPNQKTEAGSSGQPLLVAPLGPKKASALAAGGPWPPATIPSATDKSAANHAKLAQDQWAPARPADSKASRVVNSRTFDVEYDLQLVGPWGVSKIELWGTDDNGRTWQSYGVDPDNRSPFRVTVPAAGTFGFRILVDGANSAGAAPPQSGEEPELTVSVDLQPPTAELLAADLGEGNLADHLLVRWRAADTNLEPRPIALFYSSYPNGPWSTIASGLANTGSYTWRIERHVPGRFYLRLEARDTASNLATFQTPSPIALARPQPTGRLRGVRPIAGDARP